MRHQITRPTRSGEAADRCAARQDGFIFFAVSARKLPPLCSRILRQARSESIRIAELHIDRSGLRGSGRACTPSPLLRSAIFSSAAFPLAATRRNASAPAPRLTRSAFFELRVAHNKIVNMLLFPPLVSTRTVFPARNAAMKSSAISAASPLRRSAPFEFSGTMLVGKRLP